jgi:hypothetical protein
MKKIALSAAALFTAMMPLSAAQAATAPDANKQSYCELVAIIISPEGVEGIYQCFYLGDGWW